MSTIQIWGILAVRAVMLLMLGIITVFAATAVAWKNVGFAWAQADGTGMGIQLVIGAICLEIAKDWLPVIYYNQRHDAPRMAAGVLILFTILLGLSIASSLYWENVDGTNRASNIQLALSHAFAAGGPVVWYNASKWIDERPTDGLPRMPSAEIFPAPMQQPALPAPEPAPITTVDAAFQQWVEASLSKDREGQITIPAALASFNTWASSRGYPTASAAQMEALMHEVAIDNGGIANGSVIVGFSIADESGNFLRVN